MNKKSIGKLILVFAIGVLVGFVIYRVVFFGVSDPQFSALNGIVWLLLVLFGLTCVNIYLQIKNLSYRNVGEGLDDNVEDISLETDNSEQINETTEKLKETDEEKDNETQETDEKKDME